MEGRERSSIGVFRLRDNSLRSSRRRRIRTGFYGIKMSTFRHNLANCPRACSQPTQRNFEMRAWSIAVFLFSSKSFFAKQGLEANAKEQSAPLTEVSELGTFTLLSIDDVNSVLLTEVNAEYGTHRLLSKESHALWKTAIDYEWSRARGAESSTSKNLGSLRRTTEIRGTFPYLVCDMKEGKSGESCRSTVEQHFGKDLIPVCNHIDKTCYFVSALASVAEAAPEFLAVSPVLPEMKIQEGLVDHIVFGHPMPRHIQSIFCPGEASDHAKGLDLTNIILTRIREREDGEGHYLVSNHFLRTGGADTKNKERAEFWNRALRQNISSDLCKDVFDTLDIEVARKSDSFSLVATLQPTQEALRNCLLLLVTGIATQPEICWVGLVPDVVPLNAEAQWVTQSRRQESRPFFDVGLDGEGQVIGISDTGLDTDNCYFWDATGDVPKDGKVDFSRRKVVQYVPLGDENDGMKGHGTHVVGTAIGRRAINGLSESTGEADGIARAAKVSFVDLGVTGQIALRVPSRPSSLLKYGIKAGAKIHSSSWGVEYNGYSFFERDLDNYLFENPDILLVLAAGNSGDQPNSVGSPATCKNGLTVGASQNALSNTRSGMLGTEYLAWFSSSGPTHDGRLKPDVIAPGYYIQSAESRPEMQGECDATDKDGNGADGLMKSAGTSMAAPIVAGSAALVRQYFEEGWFPTGSRVQGNSMNPSSSLVKAVLINGGQRLEGRQQDDLSTSPSKEYDFHQGFGGISLVDSLPLAGKNDLQAQIMDRQSIHNGKEDTYDVTIDTSNGCEAPLSVTLVWTDPAAVAGCASCLLNDLDLHITQVGRSAPYFPNGRADPDTVNNVERIRIANVTHGAAFVVHVNGTNLESSSQNYSLIITGCFGETESDPAVESSAADVAHSQGDCANGHESILVDTEIGMKTCAWLAVNMAEYDYLCRFADVANICSATCGFCNSISSSEETKVLSTDMNGSGQWYGCMFIVESKTDLTVTSLSFHTASRDLLPIFVYTKEGTYVGSDRRILDWTLIANVTVQGQGFGNPTPIPSAAFDQTPLKAGAVQSFYVTAVNKRIAMSGGKAVSVNLHGSWSENSELSILTGYAVTDLFGRSYKPYAWNGQIQYTRSTACLDSSESVFVDNVGDRTCEWVSKNPDRFGFLCDFVNIATACPVTCDFCDALVK